MALAALAITALAVSIFALTLHLLQMIWGRPQTRLEFGVHESESGIGRSLCVKIFNDPITSRTLRKLGIKRQTASHVTAFFSIYEQGSNKRIVDVVPYIITYTGTEKAQYVSLPASFFPSMFLIVWVHYATHRVEVWQQRIVLKCGAYYACIKVMAETESIEAQRNFTVSDKHPFAYWS